MSTGRVVVAAVDLGASGGRVMAGGVGDGELTLAEVHRFGNVPVTVRATMHWDILRLHADILDGLRIASQEFELASVGIDSWGVDYGLLDAGGALIGNPVHYRDARTATVRAAVPAEELYAVTGVAHLPFNTIHQLAAAAGTPALASARTLLLIPDLLGYWLTGVPGAEVTNASTTSLLDVRSQSWAVPIMARAGISPHLFPPLRRPGDIIGNVETGGRSVPLIAVASHDTASAVAAVPAAGPDFAYISSGTWSLVGVELDAPVLTPESRLAGFTNETGVDGTIRYLRNVTGLWLLQECLRCWPDASLDALLADAGRLPALRFVIDPDDPVFLPPGDMPSRILTWLGDRGLGVPSGRDEVVRCVLDSLALAYRRALESAQSLSGRHADVLHIVGGGARNSLLCQLTADATGLPVIAGPFEATAIGNVLVQARALGAAPGSLPGMRTLVRSAVPLRRFSPSGDPRMWQQAGGRQEGGGCRRVLSFGTFQWRGPVTTPVSIKDVAAHASVSVGTVSNVLNRPEIVAEATRERVHEAIRVLGFVRNESARQLRAGRSRMIGLVVLDVANPFFTDVALGVEEEASEAGLSVILCNSSDQIARQTRHLELLEEQRVQGILLTPVEAADERIGRLQQRGTPVVLLDSRSTSGGQCSVSVDDVLGGDMAVSHLLQAGHERVGFVGGPVSIRQVADRRDGAIHALERPGGSAADLIMVATPALNWAAGKQAGAVLGEMAAGERPTGVFCANDLITLGLLQELTRRGIRVPDDVAIVGYDDIEFAAAAAVPISSVRQPRRQLGRTAARLLLEESTATGPHTHRQVIFQPELVIRESSGHRPPVRSQTARARPRSVAR